MTNAPVEMIATMRQTYNGKALRSGDQFSVPSEAEAADLVAVNMARRAAIAKPPLYETRVLQAAPAQMQVEALPVDATSNVVVAAETPEATETETDEEESSAATTEIASSPAHARKDKYHHRNMRKR